MYKIPPENYITNIWEVIIQQFCYQFNFVTRINSKRSQKKQNKSRTYNYFLKEFFRQVCVYEFTFVRTKIITKMCSIL